MPTHTIGRANVKSATGEKQFSWKSTSSLPHTTDRALFFRTIRSGSLFRHNTTFVRNHCLSWGDKTRSQQYMLSNAWTFLLIAFIQCLSSLSFRASFTRVSSASWVRVSELIVDQFGARRSLHGLYALLLPFSGPPFPPANFSELSYLLPASLSLYIAASQSALTNCIPLLCAW